MFAIYATRAAPDDPLSALEIGEQPEPAICDGLRRVKISHGSLNRHDTFTLRGITAHREGISFPMVLGNDGVGVLDEGTQVVIYPMMGSDDWREDETLDPQWHILANSSWAHSIASVARGGRGQRLTLGAPAKRAPTRVNVPPVQLDGSAPKIAPTASP